VPYRSPKQASKFEIALVVAIFAGWFILGSVNAVLTGFPNPSISNQDALGIVVLECVAFTVAASVLWSRGWRLEDFRPRMTWWFTFVGFVLFGAAFVVNLPFHLVADTAIAGKEFVLEFGKSISVSLPVALLLSVVNGVFEEFFLARYLLEALAQYGTAIALGCSALVRVAYHLYQGPFGALSVLLFGLVVTGFYWRYRQVWPVMVAHMLADLVAFV
jgi:membrane protease YdiL (CAAX protease family)